MRQAFLITWLALLGGCQIVSGLSDLTTRDAGHALPDASMDAGAETAPHDADAAPVDLGTSTMVGEVRRDAGFDAGAVREQDAGHEEDDRDSGSEAAAGSGGSGASGSAAPPATDCSIGMQDCDQGQRCDAVPDGTTVCAPFDNSARFAAACETSSDCHQSQTCVQPIANTNVTQSSCRTLCVYPDIEQRCATNAQTCVKFHWAGESSLAACRGGFRGSCQNIGLRNGALLTADCGNLSGETVHNELDLRRYIGNSNGDLRFEPERSGRFSDSCDPAETSLDAAGVLRSTCEDAFQRPTGRITTLDLNVYFSNNDGRLEF